MRIYRDLAQWYPLITPAAGYGAVRVEHDIHVAGLFDRATWLRLMAEAGLAPLARLSPRPYVGQHEVFVGRRACIDGLAPRQPTNPS